MQCNRLLSSFTAFMHPKSHYLQASGMSMPHGTTNRGRPWRPNTIHPPTCTAGALAHGSGREHVSPSLRNAFVISVRQSLLRPKCTTVVWWVAMQYRTGL